MEIAAEEAPAKTASADLSSTPGVVDLALHTRRYRARWAQLGTVEQLRVNVRIEAGHNGSAKTHVETLDLYLETKSVVTYTGSRPTNPFGF